MPLQSPAGRGSSVRSVSAGFSPQPATSPAARDRAAPTERRQAELVQSSAGDVAGCEIAARSIALAATAFEAVSISAGDVAGCEADATIYWVLDAPWFQSSAGDVAGCEGRRLGRQPRSWSRFNPQPATSPAASQCRRRRPAFRSVSILSRRRRRLRGRYERCFDEQIWFQSSAGDVAGCEEPLMPTHATACSFQSSAGDVAGCEDNRDG